MVNSEFGSSFYVPVRLENRHNFALNQQSLNWHPVNFVYALQLISMSISNVIAFLKVLHGIPRTEVPFSFAENAETYDQPWKHQFSISALGWNSQISPGGIEPLTREEILAVYEVESRPEERNQD
jgi:hypothetical protein